MPGLSADLSGLGAQLKEVDAKFASAVRRRIRAVVQESGKDILEAMKRSASWSTRIPDATNLRTSFGVRSSGVTVATSARKAPHARPYEGVNGDGMFRHPLFGDRQDWIEQHTRPFFFASSDEATPEVEKHIDEAIDEAIREAGFKGV